MKVVAVLLAEIAVIVRLKASIPMALRPVPSSALLALALAGLLGGCASDAGMSLKGPATSAALSMAPVSGGMISGTAGGDLSEADRRRAYDAEVSALENGGPGYPVGWQGDGGTHGTVIAGPPYNRAGYKSCRDYSHTIYVNNHPQISRGAACRSDDGTWRPVT